MRKASSNGVVPPPMTLLRSEKRYWRMPSLPHFASMNSKHRVSEVVDQARVGEAAVALELGHLRDDVGDRDVADRHQVDRVPHAGHVVGQALVDPQRDAALHQAARDDVELEDVRELVRDQAIELSGGSSIGSSMRLRVRLGKGGDAFADLAGMTFCCWNSAWVLKMRSGILNAEVVLQLGADVLIRALGVTGDPLEVLLGLRVVVNLEVVGRVDVPLEVVVAEPFLPKYGTKGVCAASSVVYSTANTTAAADNKGRRRRRS